MSTNEFEAVTGHVHRPTNRVDGHGGSSTTLAPRDTGAGSMRDFVALPRAKTEIVILYRDPKGQSKAWVHRQGHQLGMKRMGTARYFGPSELKAGDEYQICIKDQSGVVTKFKIGIRCGANSTDSGSEDDDEPVVIDVIGDGDIDPEPTPSSSKPEVKLGDFKLIVVAESKRAAKKLLTVEIVRGDEPFITSNDLNHETEVKKDTSGPVVIEVRRTGVDPEPT